MSRKHPEVLPPLNPDRSIDDEAERGGSDPIEDVEEHDVIDVEILDDASADDHDDEEDSDSGALADGSPIVGRRHPRVAKPDARVADGDDSGRLPATSQISSLSAYMSQLGHHAPISREQEHALAVQWREDGDVQAARQLVLSNLRLVVKIAMEYRRAWTNTLDLIQEGNIGLMEAVQRFDPYQGVKLSSYAVYWIRAFILKYILDNMRSVRLGTTRASRKLFFRLNREKARLEREGFEVEPKLIAERLDVSEDDVVEMEARLSRPDTYLDAPMRRDDSDGATVGDGFAIRGSNAESQVGDEELRRTFLAHVEGFSAGLAKRELLILNQRLLAQEPRTLADMGDEFGVSRERVRQLEARLLGQLREYMQTNMVDFDYYVPPDGK